MKIKVLLFFISFMLGAFAAKHHDTIYNNVIIKTQEDVLITNSVIYGNVMIVGKEIWINSCVFNGVYTNPDIPLIYIINTLEEDYDSSIFIEKIKQENGKERHS